jgi:uncharacterized membrane protein YobD (UPF0266 family)
MAKNPRSFPHYALAAAAVALLTGGWLVPFPLLIFFGLAPLLTFAETSDKGILEKMEWVLVALTVPLALRAFLRQESLVLSLVMGVAWTLVFVAHAWVRQTLGPRTGKITLVVFWLALEYACLKLAPGQTIFLGDSLGGLGGWTRWTAYTGYLGTGTWILMVNWAVYKAFLDQPGFSWAWLLAGLAVLAGPAIFSRTIADSPVTRETMINLYSGHTIDGMDSYLARGEWMVRTAAWISLLILVFTTVKSQTRKK